MSDPHPKRANRVRGRRTVEIAGNKWVFELRHDGVVMRRWHSPRRLERQITFSDLVELSNLGIKHRLSLRDVAEICAGQHMLL